MAACVAFNCSCSDITCPSSVESAASSGAMSGIAGCGTLVSWLNVTGLLVAGRGVDTGVAEVPGADVEAGGVGAAGTGTFSATGAVVLLGCAGAALAGWGSTGPPFSIDFVLNSSLLVAVNPSSSRVR